MRILSIDLGSWSVKAVEMESRFRRLEILDLHEIRVPLERKDPTTTYKAAVEQLLSKLPSHPERIVTSLPPAQVALRVMSFPIKQRKKVEQMYRFELEDNVPFKLDESIIEHFVSKTKDGSLVLAGIAPKQLIQKHLEWLKTIGLDADWLTFEGMGGVNIALAMEAEKDEEQKLSGPTILLDLGHSKTTLSIIEPPATKFLRNISWGGANLSGTIAMNLSVSPSEAEELKCTKLSLGANPNSEDELTASGIQALNPFLTELNHSIAAYRNLFKQEVTGIMLLGGTSKINGLEEYLESRTGLRATRLKPFNSLDVKQDLKKFDQARFSEAWGRGLALGRKAELLFNFRKEDLAKQTSLTEVKDFFGNPHIIKLAQYLGVLAVILFLHVNFASYFAEKEMNAANDELKKVFQDTFRTVPQKLRGGLLSNPEQLRKFIEQKNRELEQKLKMLSKGKTPALGVLRQITEAFPKNVRVDVNTLQFDDRNLTIEGVLYEGDINLVTEALKKLPMFNDVALQQDGARFTYRGKVIGN